MSDLPKQYDSRIQEPAWQQRWESLKIYRWDPALPREANYVIDTPPPTVSGLLHMGHVMSYTQADFIARYQRMKGMNVFYPMGFDDNGLPTERLVEKVKGVRANQMPREEFIELCKTVVKEAEEEFRAMFRSLALSVDWEQEYQTISESSRKISQMSFLDLFGKNEAYRKLQPILWDPVDQTAIAQAEVEDKELDSHMNQIIFFIDEDRKADGAREEVILATTRPELIPACVAVFYHPEDARYQHLKGKHAITPLFGVKVPFLEDDTVEPEKGTGIMMCCTFGDEADIAKWQRHQLPTRLVLNKYGKLANLEHIGKSHPDTGEAWPSVQTPELIQQHAQALNAKKATEARKIIIELLREHEILAKQDPIRHAVKCAERSGAPLEILPTYQWFVKVMDKKPALLAKSAECIWHPEWMKTRMDQWIGGLHWDWCISRQRYFGVPFPVWYSKRAGEEGKIITAHPDDLPVNPLVDLPRGYTKDEVEPDPDVMDTWATSSVSPQISSRGINEKFCIDADRHKKLFPADLRPQAHEIIRTWAFYTLAKAHLHENSIPWKNLMISGWCLAADKTKMSKSKGNVVTPTSLIEERGADAVRYWASTSRLGMDTAYSEDTIKIGKKLITKLWNAANFCAPHLSKLAGRSGYDLIAIQKQFVTEPLDKWILSRLNEIIQKSTKAFEEYEYADARSVTEECFWKDFCDNYLELSKIRAYGEENISESASSSAHATLYCALYGFLKLFAPIVPHVTDEIASHLYPGQPSLHTCGGWLKAEDYIFDLSSLESGKACVEVLDVIRKHKSNRSISIKTPLDEVRIMAKAEDWRLLEPVLKDLANAANAGAIRHVPEADLEALATACGRFQASVSLSAETAA